MSRHLIATLVVMLAATGCTGRALYDQSDNVLIRPQASNRELWHTWLKNSYFYPVRRALSPHPEATNLDDDGRVRPGSFFTGRSPAGMSAAEIGLGGGTPEEAPVMPMTVSPKVKDGTTRGFWATDARGRRYLVKLDSPKHPGLSTSAEIIGQRIYYAMGYHVPQVYLVTLTVTDRPEFDGRRATASPTVPGEILGTFKFADVKNRREMRALKLVAAWVNNPDTLDHNTLVTWHDDRATFWLLDFNGSLGCRGPGPKTPRCGWEHVFTLGGALAETLTLGHRPVPWRRDMPVHSPGVGRLDERVDVHHWTTYYPNPAFKLMTDADAGWAAHRLAGFTDAKIEAVVASAHYPDPADTRYVAQVLKARRDRLVARWLLSTPQ